MFSFFDASERAYHRSLKTTNLLEVLNKEIKRCTRFTRIFPNTNSCHRLIRVLCSEVHSNWLCSRALLHETEKGVVFL